MAPAGLLSRDRELIEAARRTFESLAAHQGRHGEIPTNVDIVSKRVSYGGTTSRVDADLWFIIGSGEYWRATGEDEFMERLLPAIERARIVPGAWEFNNCGLIHVPLTGDWADEHVQHGYVLYDQLLYLQAQRTLARMHAAVHGSSDHVLRDGLSRLRHFIRANYCFDDDGHVPDDAYHEVFTRKAARPPVRVAGNGTGCRSSRRAATAIASMPLPMFWRRCSTLPTTPSAGSWTNASPAHCATTACR